MEVGNRKFLRRTNKNIKSSNENNNELGNNNELQNNNENRKNH